MADDDKTKQDNSKPAGDGGAGEGAGSHGGASDNGEHMIPKSRFDEVNNRLKQLEADAEKRKADAAKADEARLADQNKHKELADKRAAERDDFKTKYEAAQQQIRNGEISKARNDTSRSACGCAVPNALCTLPAPL
jgi:hypothetical protein